jgi:hypothetical protein
VVGVWGNGDTFLLFMLLCGDVSSIDRLFQVEFKCYICCICYCENLI